jgi:CheY-like chemotaxis protein
MKKILIVDDDFDDLSAMKTILEKNKFFVKIATNGAQAIDLANQVNFDIFLVDVKMPTLSGYDLVRLLREKHEGKAKIIFVSIVPKQEVSSKDVDGFIQKPFSTKDFISEIKKIVGGVNGSSKKSKK